MQQSVQKEARFARLLERTSELDAVGRAVEAARAGRGGWLLVSGQAGIGKTELIRQALAGVSARGVRVAWAQGSEFERSFAFGVVRQLLEPLVAGASADDDGGPFAGAAHLARAVVAPHGEGDALTSPEAPDYASLHGLYWLCVNLSDRRPLVLVVDDVQWADEASLRWLGFVVRRVSGLPVLVVLSVRSGAEPSESPALGELLAQSPTLTLRPRALSEDATAELIARVLGQPTAAFVAACHRATRGNPLFLTELLALLRDRNVQPDDAAARGVEEVGPAQVGQL
ncbi:MAG TPA: AAA family ATPase, partial [Solirubrobacteraceae bacterium]|nr:AAA family ATPase [Solirubrobacteraceae bacterium]